MHVCAHALARLGGVVAGGKKEILLECVPFPLGNDKIHLHHTVRDHIITYLRSIEVMAKI
jgi:hypothetical protein